jgi:hypothetical protein
MLTATLNIDAQEQAELDELVAGRAEVIVTTIDAGLEGELLRHKLRPLLIEALTAVASRDPRDEYPGALIRVYVEQPKGGTSA